MRTSHPTVMAAAVAPLLLVTGQALLPVLGTDVPTAFALMIEHRDQLMLSRLLTIAGAFLLLPTLALIARHGARTTRVGAGFDVRLRRPGVGLRSMRERAEVLGGRLEVRSDASGTMVEVRVPTDRAMGARA